MKKLAIAVVLMVLCGAAFADSYTYTLTDITNTQAITYSDALPISGYFDSMYVITEANSTQTVTLASYAGTTAAITYATKAIVNARDGVQQFRTRTVGTTSAGVDLAAVQTAGTTDTNLVTTLVNVPYEKPLLGSNLKVAITGTANDDDADVTVVILYEPVKK